MVKHHHTHMHNNYGFSVIEVVIVVGIVGAILAFSVPNMKKIIDKNNYRQFEREDAEINASFISAFDPYNSIAKVFKYNNHSYRNYFPFKVLPYSGQVNVSGVDDIDYDPLCNVMLLPVFQSIKGFENGSFTYEKAVFEKSYGKGTITYNVPDKGNVVFNTIVRDKTTGDELIIDTVTYISKNNSKSYKMYQSFPFL